MRPIKEVTGVLDWVLAGSPFAYQAVDKFTDVRKIWEACKGNT